MNDTNLDAKDATLHLKLKTKRMTSTATYPVSVNQWAKITEILEGE
jgi:hypothetical protein